MYLITERLSDLNLNFHIDHINLVLVMIYMISLLPVIPINRILKLKYYPVIMSLFAITLYFKANQAENIKDKVITSGKSTITLSGEPEFKITLNIDDYRDAEILLNQVFSLNIPVKRITLLNDTNPNLATCRRLSGELIIDECCFMMVPSINNNFKNLINSLSKDNVKVTFNTD